ncbi:GPI mannosyltransferase 1 [Lutzomyia longipalpis]|uniref:GPI mannosyltransferase 1 n=1 Tax=Lutzomyia longipalpis TaxID=7200 RepID=UPI0024845ECA|nr:GPI mannosyltransferase 1 [Lutzomyia longipalpis]
MFTAFFRKVSFEAHLVLNFVLRLILILYGDFMDQHSEVPFTDIDYKVITVGAKHVLDGRSPYKSHTYRYSPLLAYLVIPNHLLQRNCGKIIFVFFDLAVGVLIRSIVNNEYRIIYHKNAQVMLEALPVGQRKGAKGRMEEAVETVLRKKKSKMAELCAYLWLYNPLTMVIATRGNGDAIASFLILMALYFVQKPRLSVFNCILAGIFHAIAIHFRLFPIAFSLPYYLSVSGKSFKTTKEILGGILSPNTRQVALVVATVGTLVSITGIFYTMYGQEFLQETYLYHLTRKDVRHNFSVFFYMQYLRANVPGSVLDKIFTTTPGLLVLLALSLTFGSKRQTLSFCLFAQAFTMVTFNSVVTSQYFVWFLALLPISAKNVSRMGAKSAIAYTVLWFLAQAAWLLSAYLLEFKGWNTFEFIWLQGLMFFTVNIFILQRLIVNYHTPSELAPKQK